MGKNRNRRKHSKIERELPDELVEVINQKLVDGHTYDEIAELIKGEGFEISRSSVGRYGKDFLARLERLKVVERQARAIVSESKDGPATDMEEAATKLSLQIIMETLMKVEEVDADNVVSLMNVLAKLQKSSVLREKLKYDINKGVEVAFTKLKDQLKQELAAKPDLASQVIALVEKTKKEVKV